MVKKIKVVAKKPVVIDKNHNDDFNDNQIEATNSCENDIPDTPTCIRCYIKNEKDIQTINGMILRFNIGKKDLVIQRVGYKMENDKTTEIDIAALHDENYSVNSTEYVVINHWFATFMKENNIDFKFINFEDSHKNSAGCHLAINGMSTLGEYITIEQGSVSDELFAYIRDRFNLPVDIVSISIPISDKSGMFITYHTEWVRGKIEDEKEENNYQAYPHEESDNSIDISVYAYTEDASENLDLVLSQFNSAIGRHVYDYAEKDHDKFYRSIRMTVTLNETGKRLIDSLDWISGILVNKD